MIGNETTIVTVTDASFDSEVGAGSGLVMVDFWAAWCGPCRMIAPILEQLAAQHAGTVKVAKLDVDANPRTTARFNVRSLPSVLFFRDGELVDTLVGAAPRAMFEQRLQRLL